MPLAGRQISVGWSLALCRYVGFKGHNLTVAVALMAAESGRYAGAWHDNLDADGNVMSTDRGLFQINDRWHPTLSDDEAYSAIPNAEYAFKISGNGRYFKPWMAYESGAYRKHVPAVMVVKALGRWRWKVDGVEERFPRDQRT